MSNKNILAPQQPAKLHPAAAIGIVAFVIMMIFVIILANESETYYVKDTIITEASIQEKATDDGKYYLRLRALTENNDLNYLSEDDSWVETSENFYNSHSENSIIGVSASNYDIYSKNILSSSQRISRSVWQYDDAYEDLAAAEKANPKKSYEGTAELVKKKAFKDSGNFYFVLYYDGREFNMQVNDTDFDKYKVNDKIICNFESIGDLVKLVGIKGK